MEIACVIDRRVASPVRPGRSGGPRPGRAELADPVEAAERTEAIVRALEGIGAAVESERPGEAFFVVDGLRGIHGGESAGVLAAARQAVAAAGCEALEAPVRVATAPTRFAAFVAATGWRRPVPVAALETRLGVGEREAGGFVEALERLGVDTLRALARPEGTNGRDEAPAKSLSAARAARQ